MIHNEAIQRGVPGSEKERTRSLDLRELDIRYKNIKMEFEKDKKVFQEISKKYAILRESLDALSTHPWNVDLVKEDVVAMP